MADRPTASALRGLNLFLNVAFGETGRERNRIIDSFPIPYTVPSILSIFSSGSFPCPTRLLPPSDDVFHHFISTPLYTLLAEHQAVNPEDKVLALFHRCAVEIPAYRRFLEARGVKPEEITSFQAFQGLPLMGKADYMQAYPLPERCLVGSLRGSDRVAVSSGSTGQPTFWPRSALHELDVALRFEQVFCNSFCADERSTLAVVCFALGNWVGGLYTTSCCWHLARKGYPLMVATPGNNKAEIFRVVREMAPHFEQTVLLGYPPFVKDVIDAGAAEGINWVNYNPKLVFAGEVFNSVRLYVCDTWGTCFAESILTPKRPWHMGQKWPPDDYNRQISASLFP